MFRKQSYGKSQSGQILLVVVLTMVVALTVGLSVVSRAITNVKISKQNEESQRAFQAAEAGIEKAIAQKTGTSTGDQNLENNSTYNVDYTTTSGDTILLNGGIDVIQDKGIDVWLSKYPNYSAPQYQGNLTVYWGKNSDDCSVDPSKVAAIEIVVLSGDSKNDPSLSKSIYDPCGRIPGSLPQTGNGGTVAGENMKFNAMISLSKGFIMKVIPIYSSTKIGIIGNNLLQPQGAVITSVGTSGDTRRKIVFFESYPQIPAELFPYSILSQ